MHPIYTELVYARLEEMTKEEEEEEEKTEESRKANYAETYYVCISEMLGAQQGARAF